ncbi:MAG TPA: hypothetical protein VGB82_10210 [Alphaproteobacteria bacterium]
MSARASSARASGRMVAVGVLLVLFGLIGTKSVGYLGFVGLALLPTLAAAIVEKPGRRSATVSIGSMTVATLFPLVLGAIANGGSRNLLTSLEAWTFVGCAVLGGAAIYIAMPAAAVWLDDMRATSRLRDLRARQDKLEHDWGPNIRAGAPEAANPTTQTRPA